MIDVLGAVRARGEEDGHPIDLRGPRHREVLGRLVAAEGQMVTTDTLVADLWPEPGPGAVGALQTFIAALRRALEPGRQPRTPARLIVTEGSGYALRLPRQAIDAHRFQDALAAARRHPAAVAQLGETLTAWRGPAYADLVDAPWAQLERVRLEELRLEALEVRAGILLDCGGGGDLAAELGALVAQHPWREPAWGLLARALYRAGRQADALAALRRARTMLTDQLGLDPSPALRRLETLILDQAAILDSHRAGGRAGSAPLGPRTTVDLARTLAIVGGEALVSSRRDRLAAALAAERTGDAGLTARVIGAYDVPAIWSRADDGEESRAVVAAAERGLVAIGEDGPAELRARLHATIAIESRGVDATVHAQAAEALARSQPDPALLAFALNARFLQSFIRPGLAPVRDEIGAELTALAERHRLPTFAILGRLIRMQAAAAQGDLGAGADHARAAERLATEHEAPLVPVLTGWFDAMVTAARSVDPDGPSAAQAAAAYRAADRTLEHAGMPGFRAGLLPLALLSLRQLHHRPAPTDPELDWGPYRPWAAPLVLLAQGRDEEARAALHAQPSPPHDHVQEALWCLTVEAAVQLREPAIAAHAERVLQSADTEHAGAGSGVLTLGPVARYRAAADACAAGPPAPSGWSRV